MATGIVITVAEKLYAVLHSQELTEVCSIFGYESQLDDLKTTVFTVKSVLLDAESKHQELTHGGRDYIERLKDAVYDVDDLLDEFNTMVQKEKNKMGGKVTKKVRRFFSRSNQIVVAYNMSHEIKNLRSKLDKIAKDHQQFGLSDVYEPLKRRDETMSFASEDYIIGREAEKESIVGMLLGVSESANNVVFVSIVGIGGLGKTALSQLVYNDPRTEKAFELRLWVCVSNDFGLDNIFRQMLGKDGSTKEGLQREVRKLLQGKRYLLVLDDVWNENRHEWVDLKAILNLGGKGSRVVVTSRSKKVASVAGDDLMYELKGLSDENSWRLFKSLAFKQGKEPMNSNDRLFDVGKEIVKKCANVPLLIRVVGSLLYDQDDSLWQSLRKANLMEIGQDQCSVMPVLKYSYYHLTPALKSCFSYCALFPKDCPIEKELLTTLWLAQGCLENPHDCQSEEDVGEEYFSILLHRCFFQDIRKDKFGEVISCKMHDLIHDLALEVAGKEIIILDSHKGHFDKRSRHLSLMADGHPLLANESTLLSEMKALRYLRTFVTGTGSVSTQSKFVSAATEICPHLRRLRVLSLHGFYIRNLPNTLGNLLQLRYLDLSGNWMLEVLPSSITKLINLLVLNLERTNVRELPRDMKKLVNLKHFFLPYFDSLTHMPPSLDTLTSLQTLSGFVVGVETSSQGKVGKLRDLRALVNLKGKLRIEFKHNFRCDVAEYEEVELLRSAPLKHLRVHFSDPGEANHETLLGCLQPQCRLTSISIDGYKGFKLPTWMESLTISLPHLVKIDLENFDCLEILPSLSKLQQLKFLKLKGISNVEFVENDIPFDKQLIFFPSLEKLELNNLPKLKGWWREETSKLITAEARESSLIVPLFSNLRKLVLSDCPNLTAFPSCPKLISVELRRCHEALTLWGSRTAISSKITTRSVLYLEKLIINNVGGLDCLFGDVLGCTHELKLLYFKGESLLDLAAVMQIASSTKKLIIHSCNNLKNVSEVVEHFTNLQSLEITYCENIKLENLELMIVAPWKSLSYLRLERLPKLVNLPKEFKYLTSLEHLEIISCKNLEALPEWLNCLPSLVTLTIKWCLKLKSLSESIAHMPSLKTLELKCDNEELWKRCRKPDGEDWPKICHIPHLIFQ